jgi:hypothetical protein
MSFDFNEPLNLIMHLFLRTIKSGLAKSANFRELKDC